MTVVFVTINTIMNMLETFLPYRLARISDAVSLTFRNVYKEMYGLNRPEWRVLASLAEIGPATATEIGRHSAQHKTKVSRAVFALEQRRWLIRETVPTDRRNELLSLTAAGRDAYARLAGPLRRLEEDFLSRLTEAERRSLAESLAALERAFGLGAGE